MATAVKKRKLKSGKGAKLDGFCAWDGDVLVLNVLGTPSAEKDAILWPKGNQLRITVTEKPVRGRATDHMVRYLAQRFAVEPGNVEVVFGRFNINKQLRIKAPKRLPAVIGKFLASGAE